MTKIENISMKETETESITLPEIPEDHIRLTHFTSEKVAQILIEEGQSFKYKGLLSSTTDAFSDNDQVMKILGEKKVGVLSRESFGNAVVIMDLTIKEHKERLRMGVYLDQEIPNHNILGYILTNDSSSLKENSKYNPIENSLEPNPEYGKIMGTETNIIETEVIKGEEVKQNSSSENIW
jgi:hypothetical protein